VFSKLVKPVYYYYSSGEVYLRGTFLRAAGCNLGGTVV